MFSQYAEDDYILECLKGISNGSLIDIGAWNPITFSNSRALIEQGWSALLIEPSPGPVKDLVTAYAGNDKVKVLAAAVGVFGGFTELEITDDAVSMPSDDAARVEAWRSTAGFYGRLTVPVISMAELFTTYGGSFEFISIDTEGTSVDLFAEMIRIGPRPRCAIVEHDNRIVELNQYAEAANYRQVHINGTNWIGEWTGRRE